MLLKYKKAMLLSMSILLLVFMIPNCLAGSYEKTYTFQAQYGLINQKLYVSTPPSLYDYYLNASHTVNGDSDYANFVTPQTVEPIAKSIQTITNNLPYSDEQFANAVLTMVHQIPYVVSDPKYPVETLVDNSGDCVSLSLLAASIMEAGGLDVVLIHYTGITPGHMNIGVYLPYTPLYHTFGYTPTYFVYNNKTYWTAEATPGGNWKVGDQAGSLANAKPVIIPLENTETSSPGEVSSSLDTPLLNSSITVDLSQGNSTVSQVQEQSFFGENLYALTISGSISPTLLGKNVSIYINNGSSYDYFTTVTDVAGGYALTWNFTSAGTYRVTTSWSGSSNYAGSDSETLTVFVGPESFLQFNAPEYNYIFGQASLSAYELGPMEGVNSFLTIPLGNCVSLSYDFTMLQVGHTVSNVQEETTTIPASQQTITIGRNREAITIQIPEEKVTTPTNVPTDLQPLMLPDDFNQTINNQFCFIFQNNGGNYSLNVNALNDYDVSNLIQGNGTNIAFMNVSENMKEDTWYHVLASMSNDEITTNLYYTNGTLIESMVTPYHATNSNEVAMLIGNNVDNAVVFKNLTVKTQNNTSQPPQSNEKTTNYIGLLFPNVSFLIFLAAAFAAVASIKKKQLMDKSAGR